MISSVFLFGSIDGNDDSPIICSSLKDKLMVLNDDIAARRGLDFSVEEWEQRLVLAMISELSEVLDEVNFKWWKNKRPVNTEALQDELVDVLHFFVSMCLRAGMSAEDLYRKYCEKNKENFNRQYGKSTKTGYNPAESVQ